jgi:hypothetical protein
VVLAIRATADTFSKTEQVIWILIAVVLCAIEIHAVNKDQADREAQEDARRWQDDFNRKQERRQFSALVGSARDLLNQQQKILGGVDRDTALMTGGRSEPRISVQLAQVERGGMLAQFYFSVHGDNPLRVVHFFFGRSNCTLEANGTIDSGGPITFDREFESYTGRGIGMIRGIAGPYPLENRRMVFSGQISALNGFWSVLVKLRHEPGGWEWRAAVFKFLRNNRIRALDDAHSAGFPPTELRRPISPVTRDDCGL